MEVTILYVVMMLDTWCTIFKITFGISVFVFFTVGIMYLIRRIDFQETKEELSDWCKVVKLSFCVALFTLTSLLFIPTTKQGMVLVASGAVIEAAKTETAQRVAGKSVAVVEKALDELLAEKKEKK